MHRYITVLFLYLSLSLLSYAQNAIFLGIPLGGGHEDFVDSLECKGYVVETLSDTHTSLSGMFDGVHCIIDVYATPKSHTIHLVSVSFTEFKANEVARMLKYRQIKKQLKQKYSEWDYRREKSMDEWSSTYARISLGARRLPGQNYKTLHVVWQDRKGWEAFQKEQEE